MSKEAQRSIAAALSSSPGCEVFSYSGCHHAFSRHGGMHFDAHAARQSRDRTLEFFNRNLA
jgi:carboxymethylenebutenolidase